MSALLVDRIEAELQSIRALLLEVAQPKLRRELFPLSEAAELLGVGMTKLRELIAADVVLTVPLGGRQMVPASEIKRLSHVDPPKVLSPKMARLAASLSKLREPIPGARAAAIRLRASKRSPGQTQDPAALRAALKKR